VRHRYVVPSFSESRVHCLVEGSYLRAAGLTAYELNYHFHQRTTSLMLLNVSDACQITKKADVTGPPLPVRRQHAYCNANGEHSDMMMGVKNCLSCLAYPVQFRTPLQNHGGGFFRDARIYTQHRNARLVIRTSFPSGVSQRNKRI